SGADVGPTLEQCRGEAGRDVWRKRLCRLVDGSTPDDVAGVLAQEEAQKVLGLSDLALEVLEHGAGGEEEVLCLRHVEAGAHADVALGPDECETALAGLDGAAGNRELEIERAELEIGGGHFGDHRDEHGSPRLLAREELGPSRLGEAADPAPDVDFPAHV